jgi:predicted kinase
MKLDNKTNEELMTIREAIEADPANKAEGLYLYTPKARRKLDAITRQITHNMAMKRAAEGRPVVADGYSGRQCNRR